MSMEITEKNFQNFVLENETPVLVDFWASWCGPCRMLSPVVDRIAEEYQGRLAVGKINVDEQQPLAERFRVMSIPTLYIFKNGEVIDKMVGARPYEELKTALDHILQDK